MTGPSAAHPPRLVLASASPRRLDLLRQIGLDPLVDAATVDESAPSDLDAATVARLLATRKAEEVAPRHRADGSIVLAADTVVSVDGILLGKPAGPDDAAAMLGRLSGTAHEVHTGVWVGTAERHAADTATTRVRFRELDPAEIRAYVATGEAADAAGAYAVQGRAAAFVTHLEGEYSNVVGLPLALVTRLLAEVGLRIHDCWGAP